MKRIILVTLALLGMASTSAFAQTTMATLNGTAVIPKACHFQTGTAAMTFQHSAGLIDQTSTNDATASTSIDVACGPGTVALFDIGGTTVYQASKIGGMVLVSGPNMMNAVVAINAGQPAVVGAGISTPINVPITGVITAESFGPAPPGTYTGQVILNIQGQ